MAYTAPLDLQYWFVNTFSGSVEIFIALALILIAGLAAFFRMTNALFFIMVFVFFVFMGSYAVDFYVAAVIFVGIFVAWAIARYYSR